MNGLMTWVNAFTAAAAGCWAVAAMLTLSKHTRATGWPARLLWLGVIFLGALLIILWISLGHPPMRTLGQTRLWYCLILAIIGGLALRRWQTPSLTVPCLLMGLLFLGASLARPEAFDTPLPPALRSLWFVPHVIVYMVAYAALGLAAAWSAALLVRRVTRGERVADDAAHHIQRLMRLSIPFLTAGLVFGAIWAWQAWGRYWSWDPKETWAFGTWVMYLLIDHITVHRRIGPSAIVTMAVLGFLIVLGAWFGVNALPTARQSVHTY